MGGREWVSLPPELLDLIAGRIDDNRDFVVFGSVCKIWQLATRYVKHPESPPDLPLLMLSDGTKLNTDDYHEELKQIKPERKFVNTFSSKSFDINLSEGYGKKCLSVGFGWLLTLSLNEEIKLLHPFSRRQIDLPNCQSLVTDRYTVGPDFSYIAFIRKAIVSCSPSNPTNCIVFVLYSEISVLAFARLGDKAWTKITTPKPCVVDIIYHNGILYGIDWHANIFQCDVHGDHPKTVEVVSVGPDQFLTDSISKYIVQWGENLLLIYRIYIGDAYEEQGKGEDEELNYNTTNFVIFKMEKEIEAGEYPYRLVEIEDLGNHAIFLGDNASVSLVQECFDNSVKGDCIYFTDDNFEGYARSTGGGHDMGIFNVKFKSFERHYIGPSRSYFCSPLWYI